MNFLFLTNPGVDMGRPDFRLGTYKTYLFPLRDRIMADVKKAVCRFMAGDNVRNIMARDPEFLKRGFDEFVSFPTMSVFEDRVFGESAVSDVYNGTLSEADEARLRQAYLDALDGFVPDTIVCWEFPTTTLRAIFPDAVVIDLMPGTFMRPPYGKMVAFDPAGIYKDSALKVLLGGEIRPTLDEVDTWRTVSNEFAGFFDRIEARRKVLDLVGSTKKFKQYALLPLQVGSYFGYRDNCSFTSQYDLLHAVMRKTPPTTGVIVTQYISNFFADNVLNKDNVEFLKTAYPNLLYSPTLNSLDNISQFIAPWADETISISSTVALQAHFFGRKVSSPSTSHLPYVERSIDLLGAQDSAALVMSRYSLPWTNIVSTPKYFVELVEHFRAYKKEGLLEAYRNWPLQPDSRIYFAEANFERAQEMLSRTEDPTERVANAKVRSMLSAIETADVVSFDVFDTLLQRRVFHPSDVFLLTPQERFVNIGGQNDRHLTPAIYSSLRQSTERAVRLERDEIWQDDLSVTEEITTEEIFARLANILTLDESVDTDLMAQNLMNLEQDVESALLEPTVLGSFLFKHAKKLKKPIIIVSDFCHSTNFVDQRLRAAGYEGYTLFVSSEHGHKKHSGNLFPHVEKLMDIKGKRIVHFGDNLHGDIEGAKKQGWQPVLIELPKVQLQNLLTARGVDFGSFASSLAFRTALNLFANRFVSADLTPKLNNRVPSLIQSRQELGHLVLGPLITAFARWIKEQAQQAGAKQILLFARDCILPYKVLKVMERQGLLDGISCFYVPASRMATKALDLLHPLDVFKVNITGFAGSATVGELLWRRFMLQAEQIDESVWREAGIRDKEQQIRQVSLAAIYRLVYLHVSQNWETVSADILSRRSAYAAHLEKLGIDTTQPSALVDIGYMGTITKIVSTFFTAPVLPLFMVTYPDEVGDDPVENGRAFLDERMAPTRHDTFRRFNLIIETLLNEPVGSVAVVNNTISPTTDVILQAAPSEAHVTTISRVHRGVVRFAEDWYGTFRGAIKEPRFETNKLLELLGHILATPTVEEATLLVDLEFDNDFAGHKPRLFIPKGRASGNALWKEGGAALAHPLSPLMQRRQLIAEGAFCSHDYDAAFDVNDDFVGRVLFGARQRKLALINGVSYNHCWIHEDVSAFQASSDVLEVRPMTLTFIYEGHVDVSKFEVMQNGVKLDYKIDRLDSRIHSLCFDARPAFPVVIYQPSFRLSRHPDKDSQRYYWRFISLDFAATESNARIVNEPAVKKKAAAPKAAPTPPQPQPQPQPTPAPVAASAPAAAKSQPAAKPQPAKAKAVAGEAPPKMPAAKVATKPAEPVQQTAGVRRVAKWLKGL
ncbi:hypothetical protein JJJ17_04275 [Paracoccus caeni]|uniref:HAD family hydrolase n=1 Tax=Paracoccus caeni TaxID=657651 RepID=A0A934SAD4_9RHOB|nr:hypothetical protein [Paracoccus caeni]MBK4215136.1 hypothetical protein [Paracoccus caeni]